MADQSGQGLDGDEGTYITHMPVFPAHFYLKYQAGLIVGALAGTLTAFASNVALGFLVGVVICIAIWLLWKFGVRAQPPIDRMRVIVLSTRHFTVNPIRSKDVIAQKSIADFDGYTFKKGLLIFAPARMTLRFDDGDEWRFEATLYSGGVAEFIRALDE